MAYSFSQVFLIALGYLLFLFMVAWITDRGWLPTRLVRHPAVYVFSLGVYASAWAIYGSIGYAHQYGYNFLAYFLGISGVFMLAPILLAPILRLTTTHQLGSLADLFAFRYRSRLVGGMTALMMLIGMLPLLSLQIKAVAESIQLLTGEDDPGGLAFWFCLLITLFAILFGARHATAREKHEGLVVAIATESLIKVVALVTLTLLGLFGVFGGPGGLSEWLQQHPEALTNLYHPLQDGTWHSMILAFFVSAVVMPHMFYMAFTENLNPRALMTASWGLPLLLLVMALCIPVILWAAAAAEVVALPDYYAIAVGSLSGRHGALLAYVAGLAGASGMLIVATLALSSMTLNHLVLPARTRPLDESLYRWLLWARRLLICGILALAYLFYLTAGDRHTLTELAVLSFVATLQFVPGLIGALFWPGANRNGLFSGLVAGFVVWALALLLPMLFPSWQPTALFDLLDISRRSPAAQWHHVAMASIIVNSVVFALVSLFTRTSSAERNAADACAVDSLRRPFRWELEADTVDDFVQSLTEPLGPVTAEREVNLALRDLNLTRAETRPYALRRLRDQVETNLSGLLGPSVAHQIVDDHLPYKPQAESESSEDIQFIESRLEQYRDRLSGLAAELDSLRRFHRQTLLELPMGVISLGADGEIIGWNLAMEQLTGISAQRTIGSRLSALPPPWNALLYSFAQGDSPREPQAEFTQHGQQRILSLHKSQVQGAMPGERAGGQVIVIEEVTDLHAMEARLTHNERLASIGRLAAGVAHEIGNPVTAIACLAQNLDHEVESGEIRQAATQIVEQTRRISRIVESLVTFSHSGGTQFAVQGPVSLDDTVTEAINLLRLDPDRRGQVFANHCNPEHRVRGDNQRLLQVFVNLLANAADASPDDAPITVRSRMLEQTVEVEIEDRGHGIPPELRDTLFEPFVTSKPAGRGTGLGLALVYSIIEDHFGSIRAESPVADQRGTRFIITLPGFSEEA
ncbi:sensory box histidine kinase [Alcanivorax sp. S71-1-4]|uniref:sensor histidine kinase n=1 Tax=Alcanivorax sp. S71-1-4 TaxID=1177159 RepID=UPI001357502C|nr:ATP-binding protein [Alcanivorax sp. S71-1-4]KAF0808734.1 sensory box histidine kinase [Alcanivorax sp. S71-1-4]